MSRKLLRAMTIIISVTMLLPINIHAESTENADFRLQIYNNIWTDDVQELSAELVGGQPDGVMLLAAAYDNADNMVAVNAVCDAADITLALDDSTAQTARFFVWSSQTLTPLAQFSEINKMTDGKFIYVDANADANGDGTFANPYNTISAAQSNMANCQTDCYVLLKPGEYYDKVFVSGDAKFKSLTVMSMYRDRALVSGGYKLDSGGWEVYKDGIYKHSLPTLTSANPMVFARQLYVNGIEAVRARTDAYPNITNSDINLGSDAVGVLTWDNCPYESISNSQYTELHFKDVYRHQFIRPSSITVSGGKAQISLKDDTKDIVGSYNPLSTWRTAVREKQSLTTPVYVENALEFLDEDGEWYMDVPNSTLYYKPRSFENINTAEFVIPKYENLVDIRGTVDNPVENVTVKDIDFAYAGWRYPTRKRAFICGQNAAFSTSYSAMGGEAYNRYWADGSKQAKGAIEVYNGRNVNIEGCSVLNSTGAGIKLAGAVQNCTVVGNELSQLGSSAVILGDVEQNFYKEPIGFEAENAARDESVNIPIAETVNPTEQKYRMANNLIADNYIHTTSTEVKSAAAVSVGFPQDTVIRNNEISDCSYSGMHIGWGWGGAAAGNANYENVGTSGLVIEKNYIHDVMNDELSDGGAIYMLGHTGGSTSDNSVNIVRGNYIADIQDAPGGIYPDEGSRGWQINGNYIDHTNYEETRKMDDIATHLLWMFIHKNDNPSTAGYITDITAYDNYYRSSERSGDLYQSRYMYVHPNNTSLQQSIQPAINVFGSSAAADAIAAAAGVEAEYADNFDFRADILRADKDIVVTARNSTTRGMDFEKSTSLKDYSLTYTMTNAEISKDAAKNGSYGLHVWGKGRVWIPININEPMNNQLKKGDTVYASYWLNVTSSARPNYETALYSRNTKGWTDQKRSSRAPAGNWQKVEYAYTMTEDAYVSDLLITPGEAMTVECDAYLDDISVYVLSEENIRPISILASKGAEADISDYDLTVKTSDKEIAEAEIRDGKLVIYGNSAGKAVVTVVYVKTNGDSAEVYGNKDLYVTVE